MVSFQMQQGKSAVHISGPSLSEDVIKRDLKDFSFNPKNFEVTAENRGSWRPTVHSGKATDVEYYHRNQAEKRRRRHQRSTRIYG